MFSSSSHSEIEKLEIRIIILHLEEREGLHEFFPQNLSELLDRYEEQILLEQIMVEVVCNLAQIVKLKMSVWLQFGECILGFVEIIFCLHELETESFLVLLLCIIVFVDKYNLAV
jgi:hypothetical protein